VDDPNAFYRAVADAPIGSVATLTVRREGRASDLKVTIEKSQTQQPAGRRRVL
jgi:S1-C subfamily serine protease